MKWEDDGYSRRDVDGTQVSLVSLLPSRLGHYRLSGKERV